jgi:hypothetical protein
VVAGDEAAVGDGDAMGVAGEIAQDFLAWALARLFLGGTEPCLVLDLPSEAVLRRRATARRRCVRATSLDFHGTELA